MVDTLRGSKASKTRHGIGEEGLRCTELENRAIVEKDDLAGVRYIQLFYECTAH